MNHIPSSTNSIYPKVQNYLFQLSFSIRYDIAVPPAATGRKLAQIVRLLLQGPELAESRTEVYQASSQP